MATTTGGHAVVASQALLSPVVVCGFSRSFTEVHSIAQIVLGREAGVLRVLRRS